MEHEIFEQLEFLIRQHLFLATHEDAVRIRLERDIPQRDALSCFPLPFEAFILRELRLHFRDQHAGREGLLDIVIRTKAQPPDLVDLRPLCRHHHDRDVKLIAELSTDLKTVHARQHDIQKDQIILAGQCFRQPLYPIDFHRHLISADFQIILLDKSNVFIIFDDQYTCHDLSSFGKEI